MTQKHNSSNVLCRKADSFIVQSKFWILFVSCIALLLGTCIPGYSYAEESITTANGAILQNADDDISALVVGKKVENDSISMQTETTDANDIYYADDLVHYKTTIENISEDSLENITVIVKGNADLDFSDGSNFVDAPKINGEKASGEEAVLTPPSEDNEYSSEILFTIASLDAEDSVELEYVAQLGAFPDLSNTKTITAKIQANVDDKDLDSTCVIRVNPFEAQFRNSTMKFAKDGAISLGTLYEEEISFVSSADLENVIIHANTKGKHSTFGFRWGENYEIITNNASPSSYNAQVLEDGGDEDLSDLPSISTVGYYLTVEKFYNEMKTAYASDPSIASGIAAHYGIDETSPDFTTVNKYGPVFVVSYDSFCDQDEKYYSIINAKIDDQIYSFKSADVIGKMSLPRMQYFTFGNNGAEVDYIDGREKIIGDTDAINQLVEKLTTLESPVRIEFSADYSESPYGSNLDTGVLYNPKIAKIPGSPLTVKKAGNELNNTATTIQIAHMSANVPVTIRFVLQYVSFGDDEISFTAAGTIKDEPNSSHIWSQTSTEKFAFPPDNPSADLDVIVTSSPENGKTYYSSGETVEYYITLANQGNTDILVDDKSVITDNLDTTKTKISSLITDGDNTRIPAATYNLDNMDGTEAGSVSLRREYVVTDEDVAKKNITISARATFQYESNVDYTSISNDKVSFLTDEEEIPNSIVVSKMADKGLVANDDIVHYSVYVGNSVDSAETENLTIVDKSDSKLVLGKKSGDNFTAYSSGDDWKEYFTITPSDYSPDLDISVSGDSWTIEDITVGAPLLIEYDMKVAGASSGDSLSNEVTVSNDEYEESSLGNVVVSDAAPLLSIVKRQQMIDPPELTEDETLSVGGDTFTDEETGAPHAESIGVSDNLERYYKDIVKEMATEEQKTIEADLEEAYEIEDITAVSDWTDLNNLGPIFYFSLEDNDSEYIPMLDVIIDKQTFSFVSDTPAKDKKHYFFTIGEAKFKDGSAIGSESNVIDKVLKDISDSKDEKMVSAHILFNTEKGYAGTSYPSTDNIIYERKNASILFIHADENITFKPMAVNERNNIKYYIDVFNEGKGTAIDFTVSDEIPDGLKLITGSVMPSSTSSSDNIYYELKDNTITWHVSKLASLEYASFSFEVSVPDVETDTVWENIAKVKYASLEGTDITSSNSVKSTQGAPRLTGKLEQILNGSTETRTDETLLLTGASEITYIATITNEGTEAAKKININDVIPDNATLKDGSITKGGEKIDDNIINWTIDILEPEDSIEVGFTISVVDVDDTFPGIQADNFAYWRNTVLYNFANDPTVFGDGIQSANTLYTNAVEAKQGFPLLEIVKEQKTSGSSTYTQDRIRNTTNKIDYRITLTNNGSEEVRAATLTDIIPEKATLVDGSITAEGKYDSSARKITWNTESIAPFEVKSYIFQIDTGSVNDDTTWTNKAQAEFSNDPKKQMLESNEVEAFTEVASVNVDFYQSLTPDEQDWSKEMMKVNSGGNFVYTIIANNNSKVAINDVVLEFDVPEGLTIPGLSSISPNSEIGTTKLEWEEGTNHVKWLISYIEAGESSQKLQVAVKVPTTDKPETYKTAVDISYSPMPSDAQKTSNELEAYVGIASIGLSKSAALVENGQAGQAQETELTVSKGDTVKYFLTIKNSTSTDNAQNVVITDVVPAALKIKTVNDGGELDEEKNIITWKIDSVPSDQDKTVSFEVGIPSIETKTSWDNTASMVYSNNPAGSDAIIESNTVTLTQTTPDVSIKKMQSLNNADNYTTKVVGIKGNEDIYYKIEVSNNGTEEAKKVSVSDNVPESITIDSSSISDSGNVSGNIVNWVIDSVPVGETVSVSFKGNVGSVEDETVIKNSASLTYENDKSEDGITAVSNEVIASAAAGIINVDIKHSLGTEMTDDVLYNVVNNTTINYDIDVTNDGTDVIDEATVEGLVGSNVVVNEESISDDGTYDARARTIYWTVKDLEVGAHKHLTFSVSAVVTTGDEKFSGTAYAKYNDLASEDSIFAYANPEDGEVNRTGLYLAIEQAQQILDKYQVSADGQGLAVGTQYITPELYEQLQNAIAQAESVYNNEDATQKELNNAMTVLNGVVNTFVNGVITVQEPEVKSNPTLSASIPSMMTSMNPHTYAILYSGNGVVSVTSSNPAVLLVTYSASVQQVTLTPRKSGTSIITISSTETSKYTSASKKYTVQVDLEGKSTNTNSNKNKNTNTANNNTNTNNNNNNNNGNTNTNKPDTSNVKLPFTDVLRSAWYYPAVQWAYSNKLLNGYAGTTLFGPNDNLTRAQAAVILWRWFAPEEAARYNQATGRNTTPFSDNPNGTYYTGAINWAYKQGVFTGYAGTTLIGPNDPLTRQQMCTVMYRCATTLGDASPSYISTKFYSYPDYREVAEYARTGVAWCLYNGVINGWDNKYIAPDMIIDRAQMAQIMMNAVTKDILD